MDKAWVLLLIAIAIAIFYQVVKLAVRNGILEAHSELVKRLEAEEADEKKDVES